MKKKLEHVARLVRIARKCHAKGDVVAVCGLLSKVLREIRGLVRVSTKAVERQYEKGLDDVRA